MDYDEYKLDNPYENQSEVDHIEPMFIHENTLACRVYYDDGETYDAYLSIDDIKMKILLEDPDANIADCFFKTITGKNIVVGLNEEEEETCDTITFHINLIHDDVIEKINE